ncbi:T9SS type A sorting domain-containing protein [Adhaeribacter pallidiroseus]|uniref:DNA helicase n=1 Tax=Adhaeribacter pallidiroseus TaxID=2072847 RepID=A0A369QQG0_9BACT|nr:T9SS type A sorting domain-containing protein [Adhaeribacter pallidiroseus]RDC65089.1 DNA helicase [Adhaeribacter pallidiroseus]
MKTRGLFWGAAKYALRISGYWPLAAFMWLLCICLIPGDVLAQIKIWDKTYGGNGNENLAAAKQTTDGGFILGGTSYSLISGDKTQGTRTDGDYWVIKLNTNGTKAWDKTFGGENFDGLQDLQQTQDGGYILGGYSFSNKSGDKTQETKGSIDYWIVKLNADGSKAWDKTIGGAEIDWLTVIQQTSDGGYILGGYSNSGVGGDKSQANKGESSTFDFWVVKLNANGKILWDKTLGGNHSDNLSALVATPDGGYLLGGSTSSDKSGDKSEPRRSDCTWGFDSEPCADYWVIKISAAGVKQWDKTFDGYKSDWLSALTLTSDGGYLLGGTSESDVSSDKSQVSRDATEDEARGDYWVIKIKANGDKVWDQTFGGNKQDRLTSLQPTPDGGFLVGGNTNSDRNADRTEIRPEVLSFWVLKLNSKGSKLWDKSVSSFGNNSLQDILLTPDGNCLLAGYAATGAIGWEKSQEGKGAEDFWVVKLRIPNQKIQTITFAPPDQGLSTGPYTLAAKASSSLPVSFKLLAGPAILKNNQLRFTGYGTVVVRAFQAGNATYSPVENTTSFRVHRFVTLPDKTIGGDSTDWLADIVTLPDGGYLLAGTSYSGKSGDKSMALRDSSDYWLVKVGADKNKIWDKSFGGTGKETLSVILATPDGGYLLGGSSTSGKEHDKSEGSRGKADYWIIKINAVGTKMWDQTFGGDLDDNLSVIVATPDGGYLLGGSSKSNKSGDKSDSNQGPPNARFNYADFWVVKINNQGKKIWDKTLGNAYEDKLTTIMATPDGNYLLGGYRDTDEYHLTDYWIVKVNPQGEILWDKAYDRDWVDHLTAITSIPDGSYLVGGYSGSETLAYWIIKINATGDKIWEKVYSGSSIFPCAACETNRSFLVDILPTPTGNFLLAGYSYSDRGGSRSEANRGSSDYWLLEIDESGAKIADKVFGGQNADELAAIVPIAAGGYLLGGSSNSGVGYEKSEPSKGNSDFWLVQTEITAFPPANLATWNRRFGGNNADNFTAMLPTADGGYLLGGYSYSQQTGDKSQNSQGKSDYWVVKTDAAGNKLWDKRYGGTGRDYLNTLIATPDGSFLLGGNSDSGIGGDKTAANKGGKDMWVIKISSSGEKQWDQSYGGSGSEDLRKIKILPDGRYLLAGYSNSPAGNGKTQHSRGGQDYWLVKINHFNGFKSWDQRLGGAAHDYLEDVAVLENGDLLLGGTSFSSAGGDKSQGSQGSSDYWLVKTTSEGQKLWDKRYGGSGPDQLFSLLNPDKDTILLAGISASGKTGEKSQLSQGGQDYWLVQVNGSGAKQWDKTYGGSGEETLRALTQDNDGGYLLGGTSFSGQSGDKSQASQGSSDYWLVKINATGTKLWDKRFGGNNAEELRNVWQTDDGGYLLGGRSNSGISGDKTQTSQGENDYWLLKVAPEALTPLLAPVLPAVNTEATKPSRHFALATYPNPFVQELTINFSVPQTQMVSLKVYNGQGHEITTLFQGEAKAAQQYACKWQASKSAAGIYILRLQGKEHVNHQRVLLTR